MPGEGAAAAVTPTGPQGVSPDAAAAAADTALRGGRGAPKGAKPAAPRTEGEEPAVPEAPKTYKFKSKIDGKEEEVEVPFEELAATWQQKSAMGKRWREIAEERAKHEKAQAERDEERKLFSENPLVWIQKQHPEWSKGDQLEWLAKQMDPLLQEQALSPERRELLEERRKREALEAKMKKEEADRQKTEFDAQVQREMQAKAARWKPALEASGLPADPLTLAAMAHLERANKDTGLDLTPEEMAKGIVELEKSRQKALFGRMTGEQILSTFPEMSRLVHKALIDRYKQKQTGPTVNGVRPAARPPPPAETTDRFARLKSDRQLDRDFGIRK